MARELHPTVESLLEELETANTPDFADLSVAGARELHDELLASDTSARDSIHRLRDLEIAGPNGPIPIRVYEPDTDGPRPIFVYYHGGDGFSRRLVTTTKCVAQLRTLASAQSYQ